MNPPSKSQTELLQENAELRARLEEAEETLRAIRAGEVDALVMGEEVYTLKGAETPYRLLIESMNEGAATLAPDGTILYCNRRFAEMVAIPAERITGSPLWQYVAPAQQQIVRALVTTAQYGGARAELSFCVPDGPGLPVLLSLRPVRADSDTIGVVAADLSERKAFEEKLQQAHDCLEQQVKERTAELRQQREWLSVTLNSIGDALIATDAAGCIAFLNPVAETLTGWSRQAAIGQPAQSVFRIVDETTRAPGQDIIARVLREGAAIKLANNTCLISRAGHDIPIEDSAAPIKDNDGKVAGAVLVFHDVTAKRRAQQALRESEQRFRSVLDSSMDCIYRVNLRTGKYEYLSPSAEKIIGFSPDELMRQDVETALAMVHPADLPAVRAALARSEEAGFVEAEYRQRAKSGDYRWVSHHMSLTRDSAGQPLYRNGTIRDITERKRTEQEVRSLLLAVQREKETLSLVLNSIGDEVWFADTNKQFTLTNPAAVREFALDSAKGIGVEQFAANLEVLRPDGSPRPVEEAPLLRALQGEAGRDLEEIIRTPRSGELRYRQVTAAPVRDAEGAIIGSVAVVRDITARKQAEEALRKSEALAASEKEFRLLAEAMPQIVWVTRADGWNIYFNQQWVDYTGLTLEESYGHGWNKPFHPDDQQRAWDAWQNAVTNRATYALECRLRRADGTYRWWLIRGVPVLDETGSVLKWFGTCTDINDLKEAEEALREAGEERLRLVLEATSMGTFEIDLRTGEGRWNTVEFELLGLRPGDAPSVPATFFRYLHPDDEARVQAQWAEATQTGILNTEFRIVRADGQVRWLAGLGRFAYAGKPDDSASEDKREPVRFLGVNFDITERKQMEEALRESESRYRAIGESIDYGVWVCAPDGRNIYASPSFLRLVGLTQEQCSSFGWGDVLHPDDTAHTIAAWKECVRIGGKWDIEHRFRGVDGQWHPILARGVPVRDEQDRVICWAGINLDISRLKQAEEALRESEERYRLLYDRNPDGIFVVDAAGRFVVANPACDAISGFPIAELLQKSFTDLCAPDQLARTTEYFQRCVRERKSQQLETTLLHKEGWRVEVWVTAVPIVSDTETLTVHCTARDITERKRLEEEVRRRADELRASNEELNHFNDAMVGRELRMIELKKEVNSLYARLGQPPRYATELDNEASPGKS